MPMLSSVGRVNLNPGQPDGLMGPYVMSRGRL